MIDAATLVAIIGDFFAAVTVGMTIWVIKYARKAVGEGKRTTIAAKETTEAAERITVRLTELLATADRYRRIYQVLDIGRTVETIYWKAEMFLNYPSSPGLPEILPHQWRVPEQNYLRQALVGIPEGELPHCESIINADPSQARGDGSLARYEIENALKKIMAENA